MASLPEGAEVRRVDIRPGDRLVVSLDHEPCDAEVADLLADVSRWAGDAVPVLILGAGVSISVVGETT